MLSAYPHLEGAYHFGEGVLPVLEKRGLWTNPAPVRNRSSVPFGAQRGRLVSAPRVAVVVGNPKPRSRTYEAALTLAERLGGADLVVDLADHTGELFDWSSPTVDRARRAGRVAADVVIVASPTYKATYTGLLKAFLDRFPHQGLGGVTAVPLMLGAADAHALAVGARPAPAARRARRVGADPGALRPRLRPRRPRAVRRLVRRARHPLLPTLPTSPTREAVSA